MTRLLDDLMSHLENEVYLLRLAVARNELDVAESHANKIITQSGEIRREIFLNTHTSGEVK